MSSEELSIINEKISEEAGCLLPFNELREFVDNGSKRIRSKLAIYYTKALGKNINTDIYNLLTSVELIHNASLLHDDVIDDSDKRRNLTTIAKKYSYRFRVVTLDGQIINTGGSMTGGSRGQNAGMLSRLNEIEKLNSQISQMEKELRIFIEKFEIIR